MKVHVLHVKLAPIYRQGACFLSAAAADHNKTHTADPAWIHLSQLDIMSYHLPDVPQVSGLLAKGFYPALTYESYFRNRPLPNNVVVRPHASDSKKFVPDQ